MTIDLSAAERATDELYQKMLEELNSFELRLKEKFESDPELLAKTTLNEDEKKEFLEAALKNAYPKAKFDAAIDKIIEKKIRKLRAGPIVLIGPGEKSLHDLKKMLWVFVNEFAISLNTMLIDDEKIKTRDAHIIQVEINELMDNALLSMADPSIFAFFYPPFKAKHMARLKALEEGEDTPDKLDPIIDGKGTESEKGLGFFDSLKKHFSGSGLYYYVWWRFENEKEYNELVSHPHSYPRNRGKLKPYYKEIGSKNLEVALSGDKSSGKVAGDFIGALGLTARNTPFEDMVPAFELKDGQILALGAARAKRWDFRTGEFRGLTQNQLMRFDPERLIWHWKKWEPITGKEEKGVIRGRLVTHKSFSASPFPVTRKFDNPSSLAAAKEIVSGKKCIGVDGVTLKLTYTYGGASISTPGIPTKTISEVEGVFEFKDIPTHAQIVSITCETKGPFKINLEFCKPLERLEKYSEDALKNIILSKEAKEAGAEEILIIPVAEEFGHKKPLLAPFGTSPMKFDFKDSSAKDISADFKISESTVKDDCYFHVFFMKSPKELITKTDLAAIYKFSNIKLHLDPPPATEDFFKSEYVMHKAKTKVTVNVQFSLDPPAIEKKYVLIFAFVAVQDRSYESTPDHQKYLDNVMYEQVTKGGREAELRSYGVLDFNMIPILIINKVTTP